MFIAPMKTDAKCHQNDIERRCCRIADIDYASCVDNAVIHKIQTFFPLEQIFHVLKGPNAYVRIFFKNTQYVEMKIHK